MELTFRRWLLQESDNDEVVSKINRLIQIVKKTEEYGVGAVKFTKNVGAVPRTLIDVLIATRQLTVADKTKDEGQIQQSKEELKSQLGNLAKLPIGGLLTGMPFVIFKILAVFNQAPAIIISAVLSMVVYYISYYSMTLAKDMENQPGADQWYRKWLSSIGKSLAKFLPDRMKNVMLPDEPKSEHVIGLCERLMVVHKNSILLEMVGTNAVYDGTRGTFNWWGAVGHPAGRIIDGHPIGTKEDKAEKRGKRKRKRKKHNN